MAKNLLAELPRVGVDADELMWLIEQRYGPGGMTSSGATVYPSSPNYALKLHHKGERLTSIERGPACSPEEFAALKREIEDKLINSLATRVHSRVMFSSTPATGFFRDRSGRFQITPPPDYAPKPPVLLADHPFVLEIPVTMSTDGFINTMRITRAMHEYARALNALLRAGIKSMGSRPRHFWARYEDGGDDRDATGRLRWAQEFSIV